MSSHAILSASSSKRWLNCPPSAKLCAEVEDTTSEYAKEGTDAHTLCEYKVKSMLGIEMQNPTDSLSYYNEEMERCANDYASYVMEVIEDAKNYCKDPLVLIEQKLDFSRFVPEIISFISSILPSLKPTNFFIILPSGLMIKKVGVPWTSYFFFMSIARL